MSPLGPAVDTQQAIQTWGLWFSLLLGMNSILTMLVVGFFWKKSREWAQRWTKLTDDLEALTESFVPKDEKGRAVHLKLADSIMTHHTAIDEMQEQLSQIYEWQHDRATGEWCKSCEIEDCPPLRSIFSRVEGLQTTAHSIQRRLEAAANDVSMTRDELRETMKESSERFYAFLMELSRNLITSIRERSGDGRDGTSA